MGTGITGKRSEAKRGSPLILSTTTNPKDSAMPDLNLHTEWAVVPYGILGAARPMSDQRYETFEEVAERIDGGLGDGFTAAYRQVATLYGTSFHTNWTRRPTKQQLIDHPTWPTEIEIH